MLDQEQQDVVLFVTARTTIGTRDLTGPLSLVRISDTLHLIVFESRHFKEIDTATSLSLSEDCEGTMNNHQQKFRIEVDLDTIDTDESKQTVLFRNENITFLISDEVEMKQLMEAKYECQKLCDLTLRVDALLRDIYFSGIYTVLNPEDRLVISDQLEDIRQENPHLFENINLSLGVSAKSIPLKSLSHADKDSKDFQNINEVKCVFCHVDKLTNKDSNFVIHPYVSKNFRNKSIYMCSTCIESWHVYRQTAQEENSLMLPGENNEELCAICSDTPETLVLCSKCPRSFCNSCLGGVVSKNLYSEIVNNSQADWTCMCCAHSMNHNPPLSRDAWKQVHFTKSALAQLKKATTTTTWSHIDKPAPLPSAHAAAASLVDSGRAKEDLTAVNGDKERNKILQVPISSSEDRSTANSRRAKREKPLLSEEDIIEKDYGVIFDMPAAHSVVHETAATTSSQNTFKKTRKSKADSTIDENLSNSSATMVENEARKRRRDSKYDESAAVSDVEVADNQEVLSGRYSTRGIGVRKSYAAVAKGDVEPIPPPPTATSKTQTAKASKVSSSAEPEKQTNTKSSNKLLSRNLSEPSVVPVADSEPILDAVYYFGIYLKYYNDNIYRLAKDKPRVTLTITDDACFLCKDGGNLVECDCVSASNKKSRCLKTYHQECLGYNLEDDVQFKCARHFCDICGTDELKYICYYCPLSICAGCPQRLVEQFGLARYCEAPKIKSGEYPETVTPIVCQHCLDSVGQCFEREGLLPDYVRKEICTFVKPSLEKVFPGEFVSTESKSFFKISRPRNPKAAAPTVTQPVVEAASSGRGSGGGGGHTSMEQQFEYGQVYRNRQALAKWTVADADMLQEAVTKHRCDLDAILNDSKYFELNRFAADILKTKMSRLGIVSNPT